MRSLHRLVPPFRLILIAALLAVTATACTRRYVAEPLVPGNGFHGIHGLTFMPGDDSHVYVGSVLGRSIYKIDTATGDHETFIGPPEGMADDLEFGPNNQLVWTSFLAGKVHSRTGDGPIRVLAEGLPGINSTAWAPDGRLFATQVFLGDALHEIDPAGERPARKIIEGMGGLNGFDFGPDGHLYGPLWFKGQVAHVNVDTGELTVVADGFKTPAAANFDSQGNLYVLDTGAGRYYRVDTETGEKTLVSEFRTTADNIAFDSEDRLYTTIIPENAVFEIDTETGEPREVISSALVMPNDIALAPGGGPLYVADMFALKRVDPRTGATESAMRSFASPLHYCNGIAVSENRIVTTSFSESLIQVFDRDSLELIRNVEDVGPVFDALELEDGSILAARIFPPRLLRIDSDPNSEPEELDVSLAGPTSLLDGGDGVIYVSESLGGRVSKVDLGTLERTDLATDLKLPEGLARMPDGRVLIAEVGRQRLVAVNPATAEIDVIVEGLPIGLEAPQGIPDAYIPTGLAVDDDGTIYVSSDLEDAIYKVSEQLIWNWE